MMTRKTFILAGLVLIALGPLSVALETFLMLSESISKETFVYFDLFRLVAIPLVFGFLIWKHLNHVGKSRRFRAYFMAGCFATFFMSMTLLPLIAMYLGSNPVGALMSEIATWSKSGGEGDFTFSTNVKLKMAIYHAITLAVANWPLFAALYFGAGGPRFPRGNNPLTRLSKHEVEKDNAALNLRKQMAP